MPAQLTDEDKRFLVFIEQEFHLRGAIPTMAQVAERGWSDIFYKRLCRADNYYLYLKELGLPVGLLDRLRGGQEKIGLLTEHQLTVINVMLDPMDGRALKKRLTESGVTTGMWQKWNADPAFFDYYTERSKKTLGSASIDANYALGAKARQGDIKAIQFVKELTGEYVPGLAAAQANAGRAADVDMKAFIIRVMEAIQKHVTDPLQVEAIANELLNYAAMEGFASRIAGDLIPLNIPIPVEQAPHQISYLNEPRRELNSVADFQVPKNAVM